ncbi:MAG: hypothetical protein FD143_3201 [Ignavibacteria bacterium]|nr:MAG: hypothetical protein FD143_3201 [Ignavibacteria bacterium]
MTLPNGDDLPVDATVGPVNLLPHSLFTNIEVSLNGKQITEPTNYYQYRAYLETLINYSTTVLEKRMQIEGWRIDTAGSFAITNAHEGANNGHRSRKEWIARSRTAHFILHPRLDIFHQDSDIPPNTDIRIRLIPNRNPFYLMSNADIAYHLAITNIRFWIKTHEVTSSYLLNQQSLLHSNISPRSFKIVMPSIRIKTLNIPIGTIRQEFDNLYMGALPHRIIFAMVQDSHMNGSYRTNPYFFNILV